MSFIIGLTGVINKSGLNIFDSKKNPIRLLPQVSKTSTNYDHFR